jgi:hypothetical protein
VIPSGVAEPLIAVVAALVFDFAEPVVAVVAEAVSEISEPVVAAAAVVFVVDLGISELLVVFVALLSIADVAEPQVSVYIVLAFDVLVPVSAVSVVGYSSRRPKFFSFPNID